MASIDVHTHMFTPHYMELLKASGGEYNLKIRPDGQLEVFRRDTPVVLPQKGHFDYELRLRAMDAAGIDLAIVSLTCPNVFWGGEAVSREAARESNASMAAAQKAWPDRIRWLASLPWEYPQAAIEELRRSREAGAVGVMVLANVAGASLTEPRFASVWAEIERLGLPALVHPTDLPGIEAMNMRDYDLSWSVGFIADTTLAFARMIFDGFLDRFPNLSLIASHGGGALPYIVGRFDKGDEVEIPARRRMKARPSAYLKRIWYDSITYHLGALRYLIEVVGADRVMLGTDYPHQVHDMAGAAANTAALPDDERSAIREGNARRLFKI
ncbi:MAG TPA: amidohydrolase family protein [Caulobacteraceae bacterium]|jgi:aminocarboxymuconate-semialdehyde decarboxylase